MDIHIHVEGGTETLEDVESLHIMSAASTPYIEIHWVDEKDELHIKTLPLASLIEVHVLNE